MNKVLFDADPSNCAEQNFRWNKRLVNSDAA